MQLQPATAQPKRRAKREPPKLLAATVGDTCRMTGLGRTMVYQLIREGRLQSIKVGRRTLVLGASIETLLQPEAA